jgi:hypothetical protein
MIRPTVNQKYKTALNMQHAYFKSLTISTAYIFEICIKQLVLTGQGYILCAQLKS